jgi:hypothetical protein
MHALREFHSFQMFQSFKTSKTLGPTTKVAKGHDDFDRARTRNKSRNPNIEIRKRALNQISQTEGEGNHKEHKDRTERTFCVLCVLCG